MIEVFLSSPDDAKIIKVASSTLGAKGFLKGEDDTGHAVPVPDRPKDSVSKPAVNTVYSSSAQQHTQSNSTAVHDNMHKHLSLVLFLISPHFLFMVQDFHSGSFKPQAS